MEDYYDSNTTEVQIEPHEAMFLSLLHQTIHAEGVEEGKKLVDRKYPDFQNNLHLTANVKPMIAEALQQKSPQ